MVTRGDIVEFASQYQTPDLTTDEDALADLMNRLDRPKIYIKNKVKYKLFLYAASTAAAILIIGSIRFFFNQEHNTIITTARGQQISIFLPDSSEVVMNASSVVNYNPAQWKTHRTLELQGEAFFKVKKGSRFEVISKHCTTTVLGTSFNILSRDNQYRVSCFTGKVWVKTKNKKSEQLLNPGYETNLSDNNQLKVPEKFDAEKAALWQKGEFYFHNEPFVNVIIELERQYNITVKTEGVDNRNFTGYFYRNDLQQALKLVCEPMQLTYLIQDNKITIRKKK